MNIKITKAILKAEYNHGATQVNFKNGHLLSAVSSSYFTYFWLVKSLLFKKMYLMKHILE